MENNKGFKLTVSEGVLDSLYAAASDAKSPPEFTFFLSGDLIQMSIQKSFLQSHGFTVGQTNVYPILKEEDVTRALTLILESKCEGWWNYDDEYIKRKICTKKQWDKRYD